VADRIRQRADVGGGFEAHRPGLPAVGTDHPSVCYRRKFAWISHLGRSYHRPHQRSSNHS
jgi:hypothetical protein